MKKRIIGLLMALCLIVGLLPVTALADEAPASAVKKVAITTGAGGEENRKVWTEDFAAPVYGKTSEDGTSIDWEAATAEDYNIAISQSAAGLELTLKDANIKLTAMCQFAIWVQYDGPLTINLIGENDIYNTEHNSPACLFLRATSTVITGGGSLSAYSQGWSVSNDFDYDGDGTKETLYRSFGAVIDCDNDLTIKDVTLDLKQDSTSSNPWTVPNIRCSGNVVIDNATVNMYGEFGNGIQLSANNSTSTCTDKTLTIKNGAKVTADVYGFAFRTGESGTVIIDKTNGTEVVLKGLSGAFKWTPVIQGTADVEIVSSVNLDGSGAKPYTYQEKQLIAEYTELCYFSLTHKHTGGTATCSQKAVCTICNEEYGETAAHTFTRTDCSKDSICSVCNQVAVPAGGHVGGTATCTAKAKCDVCKTEYGDLLPHTAAEDDKDCSTAVKCTVCNADVVAAKTHRFTDDSDKSCNNYGCEHTRTVTENDNTGNENDNTNTDKPSTNPNTGDVNILLTAAIALSSAAGLAGVTVLRKKEN